jgi:hypothetical protein
MPTTASRHPFLQGNIVLWLFFPFCPFSLAFYHHMALFSQPRDVYTGIGKHPPPLAGRKKPMSFFGVKNMKSEKRKS